MIRKINYFTEGYDRESERLVIDLLYKLGEKEVIRMYNAIGANFIYPMNKLDKVLSDFTPSEIIEIVSNLSSYISLRDKYFELIFTKHGIQIASYNSLDEDGNLTYEIVAEYIVDHRDSLGNSDVQRLIDTL